jgi:TolB protein
MGTQLKRTFQRLMTPFRFFKRKPSHAGEDRQPRFPLLTRFGRFLVRRLGLFGLAIRHILSWTVGETIALLFIPLLVGTWRFIGNVGLAIRELFMLLIWRPALPLRWAFRKFIWSVWSWLARLLHRFIHWLAEHIRTFGRFIWRKTERRRTLYGRRAKSHWIVLWARWRVFVKRPHPPRTHTTLVAPRLPMPPNIKIMRITTALASVGIVLIVGFVTAQPTKPVEGSSGRIVRVILTPTPVLETPTPVPTPAIPIELTPWPTPDPLNEGGSVAFTLHQDGNSDIYVLSVGQAEAQRITSHAAPDREPVWSPDGRELAFSSRRDGNWEVYVYNLASGQLRRITNHVGYDGAPGWSPDGQWLVYDSYQADNLDIYIVKADLSQGPFRLTQNPAHDYAPVWSPGGRNIAFTSWRSGNQDIFMLSLDQVSDETAVNITASPNLQEDDPAFSPDGNYLAYHENSSGFDLIYASPLAGTRLGDAPINLGQQGRYPAWSPNSQSLFYVYSQGEQSFLIAGSPDAWGIAPQTYAANGRIQSPHWSAVTLPPDIAQNLRNIDRGGKNDPLYREALAPAKNDGAPVLLWEVAVNAPTPYLNDRVDQSFLALRDRIVQEAGWDFLGQVEGLFMDLESKPVIGLPKENWNQAGRAFDFVYEDALSLEPRLEVVREDIGSETFWRVYLRAEKQDGSQGEPLRQLPWDFRARFGAEASYFDEGGKVKDAIPAGYYVDFTALAADYGWQWLPSTTNWRTFFPGVRFWHYENRQGLTWPEAMLEIYTPEELIPIFGELPEEA